MRCRRWRRAPSGSWSSIPARWPPLGIARGDLLGVPGGATAASRAALARAVAHGLKPALAVERGGQRYVLAAR